MGDSDLKFPGDDIKIILCATDAGGIRNIVPLIPVCSQRGIEVVLITYRNRAILFGETIANVDETFFVDNFTEAQLRNLIIDVQPEAVICGTTRFYSPDRILVPVARASGVRTVAVFDEWFSYSYRFEDPETKEFEYLPDAIALQDKQAKEEAVLEGIPGEICYVTGSPALAEQTKKAQKFLDVPPDIPDFLTGSEERPIVTFISETHAADYGTSPDSHGPLGPFIGYTEDTVLEGVLNVLGCLSAPMVFVEKLHPAADIEKRSLVIPKNLDYYSVRETDLLRLLWHSDIVIGMRSMALLEAHILGCETVSFQPGLIGPEHCTAVRLGLIPKMEREKELESWLAEHLSSIQKKRERVIRQQPFAEKNAAERVIDLALNKRGL